MVFAESSDSPPRSNHITGFKILHILRVTKHLIAISAILLPLCIWFGAPFVSFAFVSNTGVMMFRFCQLCNRLPLNPPLRCDEQYYHNLWGFAPDDQGLSLEVALAPSGNQATAMEDRPQSKPTILSAGFIFASPDSCASTALSHTTPLAEFDILLTPAAVESSITHSDPAPTDFGVSNADTLVNEESDKLQLPVLDLLTHFSYQVCRRWSEIVTRNRSGSSRRGRYHVYHARSGKSSIKANNPLRRIYYGFLLIHCSP